jgi:hypothetical protein
MAHRNRILEADMKKLLAVLLALVLIAVVVVTSRPGTYHIERSATVAAAPETVYAQLVDFRRWAAWSPWEGLDPSMKKTYSGPAAGTGAIYEWTGNGKVGQGRMTILDARPSTTVAIKLEFIKPFAATCATTFSLVPANGGTQVTWAMDGTNDFMAKAFGLFMDMDKSVGRDFERGLATLRSVAEHAPAGTAATDSSTAGDRPS